MPDIPVNGSHDYLGAGRPKNLGPTTGAAGEAVMRGEAVTSVEIRTIKRLTQAQFDALIGTQPDTMYLIIG